MFSALGLSHGVFAGAARAKAAKRRLHWIQEI